MKLIKPLLSFTAAAVWISFSEFLRNEIVFKHLWISHYQSMGLVFPSAMINNAVWGIWSFFLAGLILTLSRKMKLIETIIITWAAAFVMMWLVIGNLNVLPFSLLFYAVPWSLVEVILAALIIKKINR
jgi:hypothetical protein